MTDLGVTDSGYELLRKTGLEERIEKNWGKLRELMPYGAILDGWEIEEVLKKDLPSERRQNIQRWMKENDEYNRKPIDLFMISGAVTDTLLTKEERDNFKKFGVESLSQLDGLLAAYYLEKKSDDMRFRGFITGVQRDLKHRFMAIQMEIYKYIRYKQSQKMKLTCSVD